MKLDRVDAPANAISDELGRDERLVHRWLVASGQSEPAPATELLSKRRRPNRHARVGRGLATVGVAAIAVVVAVSGVGAWMSFRSAPLPGSSATVTAINTLTPKAPTSTPGVPSVALGERESILRLQRTAQGGWVLTNSRLLLNDGTAWRECWKAPGTGIVDPGAAAVVDGSAIKVAYGSAIWLSTDACATWTSRPLPIVPTGMAFPADNVGYIAAVNQSGSNRARIFRTDDDGLSWQTVGGSVSAPVEASGSTFAGPLTLAFSDADHGWLTDRHTLWSTSNGGHSWTVTQLPVPASVKGEQDIVETPVVGQSGTAAVAVKYDLTPGMDGARGQEVFYQTGDFGAHWRVVAVLTDPGALAVSLANPQTWVTFDRNEKTRFSATSDGGNTWHAVAASWPIDSSWINIMSSINFADSQHGWLQVSEPYPPCPANTQCDYMNAPPQHLLTTDDGGATWQEAFDK